MYRREQGNIVFIYYAYMCVLVALCLSSVVFAPQGGVLFVNGWHTPALDACFAAVTNLGNGVFMVPLALVLCFRRYYMAVGLVVSGLLQGLLMVMAKNVFFAGVGRPMSIINPTAVHFIHGVEVHRVGSFPSGHTVTAFGLAVFISLCYRNRFLSAALLGVATLVALSRVYLLQHFVTDIAAGAIIGTITGIVVYTVFYRMHKPQWMRHRLDFNIMLGPKRTVA